MILVRPLRTVAALGLTAGFGAGAFGIASLASADPLPTAAFSGHALFVETDQSSGNQILSYTRAADGTVSLAGIYATGGDGGTAAGATADPLASQGGLALVNGGRELLAVNAGSNTVSLFSVWGTSLVRTQTVSSGGAFPVSIADDGSTVAVLNAGNAGSVAEFRLIGATLVPLPGEVRSLGLDNTNPPDYLHGAGQVGFTPDGTHLVVTTKASTSSYDVFNVTPGGNLSAPVVTASATPVPFAFSFDAAGHLVGAEAGTSTVSTYAVEPNGSLTLLGSAGDGGTALCWITGVNGTFYGSNAGTGTLSSFSVNGAGAPVLDAATAAVTHPGTTDSAASPDGKFLYVESGGSGAFDAFAVNANGSLNPVETVWNIPVGSEGIAVS
ncbi:MAG: lactonase family protein [Acidimicrobiales bacterium]